MSKKNDEFEERKGLLNTKLVINLTVIVVIIVIVYYGAPYLYKMASDEDDDEDYTSDRKRSDTQDDWDIVKEIKSILKRQKHNITKLSQTSSYGI